MLYNIEIAQLYNSEKRIKPEAFYKSMLRSFKEAVDFCIQKGMLDKYKERIEKIVETAKDQRWFNTLEMQDVLLDLR